MISECGCRIKPANQHPLLPPPREAGSSPPAASPSRRIFLSRRSQRPAAGWAADREPRGLRRAWAAAPAWHRAGAGHDWEHALRSDRQCDATSCRVMWRQIREFRLSKAGDVIFAHYRCARRLVPRHRSCWMPTTATTRTLPNRYRLLNLERIFCRAAWLIKAPLHSLREEDHNGTSPTWPHGDAGQRAVPGLYDVWRQDRPRRVL